MRKLLLAALFGLVGCATPAPPAPPAPPPLSEAPAQSVIARTYSGGVLLDPARFLDAPPMANSVAQNADLAAVRAAQKLKGQARWALAQSDDENSPFSAFGSVLGDAFTKANAPKTAALFDILFADARGLTGAAKEVYGRPRPPVVDKTLTTCVGLETSKSYPSGHATRGWMMALVLSEMVPEKANALLDRGRDYGWSRVVCAEHFPSDVEAGRLIGSALFAAVKTDPLFERDFAAARKEVRAALGLPL